MSEEAEPHFPWRTHWSIIAGSAVCAGLFLLASLWLWPPAPHQAPIQVLIALGAVLQAIFSSVFVVFLRVIDSRAKAAIAAVHVAALIAYLPLAVVLSGMHYPK